MQQGWDTPWAGRGILHVDMDAFFASVEQLDHPEWRGRPVIVGGDRASRGVVSTCSYEARAFGVRSAMPSSQAARLCPQAVWVSPRFGRYAELSGAVREILARYTPDVEPTSIDEAYLDVTPGASGPHPVSLAEAIQREVDELSLSCSIGVATSKTVAKIASDHDKPHGITVVEPGREREFLAPLGVRALPGIGASTAARLAQSHIRTIGQLATLDHATAFRLIGSWGPDLVDRARGIDPRPVLVERGVKSISHEHTFSTDVRERSEVEDALRSLVARVAARLRKKDLVARTFTVKLRYADFSTPTVRRTVEMPTDLDEEMFPVALELLRSAWSPGTGLRLLGFGASGFADSGVQLDLFSACGPDDDVRSRRAALARGVDAVRARFGAGAVKRGAEMMDRREDPGPHSE
ncbi:MAG: DNA polymerase IV [Actinomycetia bacterium]|nr:DNA polymerase IV [Actinomycetes bacterium]